MKVSSKYKTSFPLRPTANLGTSVFCQPQAATAQNTKEPKFTNRTPTPKFEVNFKSFRPP
jgi:hypothetical protein